MASTMGMADFFALEAGEYLDRLDVLLVDNPPDAEEFVRLARALRGAAIMASHSPMARAAQGLESLARALDEDSLPWDERSSALATGAIDELRLLLRRVGNWSDDDTDTAEAVATRLEAGGGRRPTQPRALEQQGLDTGARAFVAREGATIASALDRAAAALRLDPHAGEPMQAAVRAMQPLRGLAAIQDLPPLPDLLEGIERAVNEIHRRPPGEGEPAKLFEAAARAVVRASREVAEHGQPDAEAPEARAFVKLLSALFRPPPGAVPIESLFYADGRPGIIERGARVAVEHFDTLEIVSQGEHLKKAADDLDRAVSDTQRELRVQGLMGPLLLLGAAGGSPLNEAVGGVGRAAAQAVERGVAVNDAEGFAAELRAAGARLSQAAVAEESLLLTELTHHAERLAAMAPAVPLEPVVAPAPTEEAAEPTPARAADAPSAAAPVPVAPVRAPVEEPSPARESGGDLAASLQRFEDLRRERGITPRTSLDELLEQAPREATGPRRAASMSVEPAADLDVVPIEVLLYGGEAALQRILDLRTAAYASDEEARSEALNEIFDLVSLALTPSV